MARKDLMKSVLAPGLGQSPTESRADYAMRGASKSMKASIDSLAEDSRRLLEGETIVDVDPSVIDGSFVGDRLTQDDEDFRDLKASIAAGRQDSPVLLRPHPTAAGRFMVVFGHRRVRVAAELGRKVRAVIKGIDDVAHVLAQGQENAARSNLSFIERAVFAQRLHHHGLDRDVILAALRIDATLLSRMLSVAQAVPSEVIEAIGPAKTVGRDRWEDFKKLVLTGPPPDDLREWIRADDFLALGSEARFEVLLSRMQDRGKVSKPRATRAATEKRTWIANGGEIKGIVGRSGRAYSISLTSRDSAGFGAYLSQNLDQLYEAYLASKTEVKK